MDDRVEKSLLSIRGGALVHMILLCMANYKWQFLLFTGIGFSS